MFSKGVTKYKLDFVNHNFTKEIFACFCCLGAKRLSTTVTERIIEVVSFLLPTLKSLNIIVDLRNMKRITNGCWQVLVGLSFLLSGTGCGPLAKSGLRTGHTISQLRLIDIYEFPSAVSFKGITIGGLSGIDYDPSKNIYYLICDDRSDIKASRFYTAEITLGQTGIDSIKFLDVVTLTDKSGRPYASLQEDPLRRADPEGIRLNKKTGELVWSNEGERTTLNGKWILINPALTVINQAGQCVDSFQLPANLQVHPTENGIRKNGGFEGLTFNDTYSSLYVCVEEPLYEDGHRAGLGDSTAWIRFVQFDVNTRKQVAQYAYKLDAIPYPASPPDAFKINGVPEILYFGENKLLVIERAFSTGRQPCTVKIYLADLSEATDVSTIPSLTTGSFRQANKKRLLNLDDLGRYIDNVEGLTFGPDLPSGNKTLLLVSDDNFSVTQKTQFFLFEVISAGM